jgi:hypothetical protein
MTRKSPCQRRVNIDPPCVVVVVWGHVRYRARTVKGFAVAFWIFPVAST